MNENAKVQRQAFPRVGDRVRILEPRAVLKHRQNRNGVVTNVNGAYIMVRPMWCKWEAEFYPNELQVLGRERARC